MGIKTVEYEMEKIQFSGSDFLLSKDDISQSLYQDLCDCGAPGDASEAVDYIMRTYDVSGDESDCATYLRGCGAWDDSELEDHYENLRRLVWIAGCDMREYGEAYLNTYAM